MTARAAGHLYRSGLAHHIIFSTGHTAGSAYPAEAGTMYDSVAEEFGIPIASRTLEEKSWDTPSGLIEADKIREQLGVAALQHLTVSIHALRVNYLTWRLGIPSAGILRTQQVLREAGDMPPRQQSMRSAISTARQFGNEIPAWGLNLVDPRGEHVTRYVTRLLRHQQDDSHNQTT